MKKLRNMKALVAVAVSLMTFLVYLPSLGNTFLSWDDGIYVTENSAIQKLDRAFFRWAFTAFHAANWHPLTWISHALDYAVWGLNPLGHHLTNNILHAVNTFLVVLLVVKLMEACKPASLQAGKLTSSHYSPLIVAGVTGLLFGIHPIHVESVAWVSERKDLLCALFYLLSVMAYMKYAARLSQRAESKEQRAYISMPYAPGPLLSALCFFILALMSKPMAVSLPVVLLLLDWYPFGRIRSVKTFLSALTEKIPFIAFSLVSSVLTILAQSSGHTIAPFAVLPLTVRALVAIKAITLYLSNMVLPVGLLPLYPYPGDVSLTSPVYFLPILLVVVITAVAVAAIRKTKAVFAAWSYFLITLLPVLGIVQVGDQAMADRYSYLPSIGPFLLAGMSAAFLLLRSTAFGEQKLIQRFMLLAGMGAVPCILAYATIQQIAVWKDSFVLWDYTIRKNPSGNPFAYNSRGLVLRKRGQLDEAIADFERALAIRQDTDTLNNLGIAYYEKGLYEKAVEMYGKAVLLSPGNSRAYTNLGVAYAAMSRIDLAIENFRKAISLSPDNSTIYNNLARALRSAGRIEEAEENYRKAVALNPYDDMAFLGLGSTYMMLGRLDEALEAYTRVIELSPNNPEAYRNRGIVYARKGDTDRAAADFRMACALGSRESCGYLMNKP